MKILLAVDGSCLNLAAAEEVASRPWPPGTALGRREGHRMKVEAKVLHGHPKTAILDEARDWGSDLIVVGSHGMSGMERFFLGSVSLAVTAHAHCSVEIVRPKETEMR